MSPEMYAKELRSIQKHGFIDPITVRETETGLEIVDGEHRWRAAQELQLETVLAINLGPISDDDAKRLTLLTNELRGEPEPVKLAKLMKELAAITPPAELALDLPMAEAEIDSLVKAADFSWDTLYPTPETAQPGGGTNVPTGAEERRFVMAGVQGHVPVRLSDAFLVEWRRSSEAIQSNNIELVMADMIARLQVSEPKNIVPKPAAPTKRGKKKADNGEAPDHPKV